MRVVADGVDRRGRAIDLRQTSVELSPAALLRAVRGDSVPQIRLDCRSPAPAQRPLDHVDGSVRSLNRLLASAARSRGHRAPQRDRYESVRAELRELDPPEVDLTGARRRVASADADETRLRERVATLRGKLQARRELGTETSVAETDLADATTRLSEVETERIAAEQALERAEARARDARNDRRRRLELQDRAANLERAMREALATAVYDEFAATVRALDANGAFSDDTTDATPGPDPSAFEGDDLFAQLAAVRIADRDAPVVVSTPRCTDGTRTATALRSPVLLL